MATSLVRPGQFRNLDPWRVMEDMERQMWDWMSTPFGYTPLSRLVNRTNGAYVPPVDVYETPEDVLVAASLPGIDASKVSVQVNNGLVTISGEQQPLIPQDQQEGFSQHYAGIPRYGQFSFSVSLPCEVDTDRAEARYVDGILRVRFPKAQKAKPVQIAVTTDNTTPTIENRSAPKEIESQKGKGK